MVAVVQNIPFDFHTEGRYSPIYKTKIKQLTLSIPGGGCKYWLNSKGKGCTFCGFPGLTRLVVQGEGHETDFNGWRLPANTFWQMYQGAMAGTMIYDKLAVFNGGSFFVDAEIPADFRKRLYSDFAHQTGPRQLMVESRPEYVTQAKLDEAGDLLDVKDFMVGIGLESSDNHVRNKLLKKGTSRKHFEQAVRLMQASGVQVFVYAFLKAPGLSERGALDDIIQTLTYLHDLGVDEIGISCAFVPPQTPLETLYRQGLFRPPWLWTILEIIHLAHERGYPISVGGFDDQPPPIAVASNCEACDADILSLIDGFRTGGVRPSSPPHCSCRKEWKRELENS